MKKILPSPIHHPQKKHFLEPSKDTNRKLSQMENVGTLGGVP